MEKKRGRTPSLLTGSSGKPTKTIAQRCRKCTRCSANISKNEVYFEIPKVGGGFTNKKPFCLECFKEILNQTKIDLSALEESVE
jgi:hypothetical protein